MIIIDILLWILKWIGILLLLLLGLLLFLVLVVLLAPVRYKGRLRKTEEPEGALFGEGKVTWLNPILRVRVRYEGKKLVYRVRLFGFCIVNSEKPKKEKKKKKSPETAAEAMEVNVTEPSVTEENGASGEPTASTEASLPEQTSQEDVNGEEESSGEEHKDGEELPETEEASDESGEEKKVSFFGKIKGFFGKIKAFFVKIKNLGTNVKKQISLLWYKKGQVMSFLKDEIQKRAFGKAWGTVKKVLRHVLPQKVKGRVEFGTGNPESTGKALAGLAIFYGKYGKHVTIVPEFMEKRLVGEITFKGRIRFGTLARLGLSLLRDKNVKGFRKNWKKLLKELKKKAE